MPASRWYVVMRKLVKARSRRALVQLAGDDEPSGVPAFWGLQLMVLLVRGGHMPTASALRIATAIAEANPRHITTEI